MPATVLTIGRAKVRVSEVNKAAQTDSVGLFNLCNEKYEKKIQQIARRIADDPSKARLIMLSGPSASSKTTTSLKIQNALKELGCGAVTISMDDFFKNREDTPIMPDGTRDYESSEALDTALLKETLSELITTGRTSLPVFKFKLGQRANESRPVILDEGHVAIMEGLHALNPKITELLPPQAILKLYVSVSSDFVADTGETVLCARDVRFVRRMVRDFHFRGANVEETLDIWDSVCHGEDLYVRPFKKCADITVNSAFSCEPCLFREVALKLLGDVNPDSPHAERVRHIMDGMSAFEPVSPSTMPGNCVLREFMGGSDYYNHKK
jgi:uridine kinase